jgi:hypothetical protein
VDEDVTQSRPLSLVAETAVQHMDRAATTSLVVIIVATIELQSIIAVQLPVKSKTHQYISP